MSKNPLLQFFEYGHLKGRALRVSKPFGEMAHEMATADLSDPGDVAGLGMMIPDLLNTLGQVASENPETSRACNKLGALSYLLDGDASRLNIDTMLVLLLEAKDCAVRAALFKSDWGR